MAFLRLLLTFGLLNPLHADPGDASTKARPNGEVVPLKHLRPSSPADKARWEQTVDALWKTPLGELYGEYLFSPSPDHADLPAWARLVVERIFQEPNLLTIRVMALQIMAEDLYVREKLTPDVVKRAMILGQHIEEKELLFHQHLKYRQAFVVGPMILLSLPFGSRALRQETVKFVRAASRRVLGRPVRAARRPRLARAWANFGDEYSVFEAAGILGLSQYLLDGGFYLVNDWLYGSRWAPKDRVLLAGLDDLVRALRMPTEYPLPTKLPHR